MDRRERDRRSCEEATKWREKCHDLYYFDEINGFPFYKYNSAKKGKRVKIIKAKASYLSKGKGSKMEGMKKDWGGSREG